MSMTTSYHINKYADWYFRAQVYAPPATLYIGLILVNKGFWVASTAYALNDYVLPVGGNGRLYKCSTAGTSGAAAPTWPTTAAGTVADGTAVWTEQTTALKASGFTEVSGGAYARVAVTSSLANWAGTHGVTTVVASSGSSQTTSNNGAITFPTPTANWGVVFAATINDAATAGNCSHIIPLTTPQTINNGQVAPVVNISQLTLTFDNN